MTSFDHAPAVGQEHRAEGSRHRDRQGQEPGQRSQREKTRRKHVIAQFFFV